MKNTRFYIAALSCLLAASVCNAQSGNIFTVAGGGTNYPEGVPAIESALSRPGGISIDAAGNIYVADNGRSTVRKIGANGIISSVAGNSSYGYVYDGGAATSSSITDINSLYADAAGNLYLSDNANNRIRKVTAATGKINTIAGGGSSYSDGIPATDANIYTQSGICVDLAGNIYCSGFNCVRKIDAVTGTITTVAGGGLSSADGVPATYAAMSGGSQSLSLDGMGNLYILINDNSGTLRKVDRSTGFISTIPGYFGTSCCIADGVANIFFVDGLTIKRRDAGTGVISTIAGGGTSAAEGASAISSLIHPNKLYLDAAGGNVYFTDDYSNRLRKFSFSPINFGSDSFAVFCNKACSGPEMNIVTPYYFTGRSVKTYFGDGATDSSVLLPGPAGEGIAAISHAYQVSGTYTIKEILYQGAAVVDSFTFPYLYSFCRTLPVQFYNDVNGNCVKDAADPYTALPVLTEVDRNGAKVGVLSATSGFYYNAYGAPGDIFTFKAVPSPNGLVATCPATGTIDDTILSAVTVYPGKYFGVTCPSVGAFDLALNTVIPTTGIHRQIGYIYVSNNACESTPATVTFNFNQKWMFEDVSTFAASGFPYPTSVSGNSASWDLSSVAANDAKLVKLYYQLFVNPSAGNQLPVGDTSTDNFLVNPTSGDLNPGNNSDSKFETVRAGFDPNEMFVSPESCLQPGTTQLKYAISFENTGNDTAHNIYVMDTLSDFVDPSSLTLVTASATMNTTLLNYGNYNIVRFDFPQINILDSSHHGQCDGAVIFNINLKNDLPLGTIITNEAGIYFDENPVVMTNAVSNTIGCPPLHVAAVAKPGVEVFPNPATDELTIKMDKGSYSSFTISNSIGQIMLQQQLTQTQTNVNVKALPPGLYYISLRGDNGSKVMKFVKM